MSSVPKIQSIPQFFTGSFAVDFGDHLPSRIIFGPFWGSLAVSGSFAVGDHLRYCTVLISNQLRHFSIPILLPVTLKELKKGFIKGEALRLLRTNSSKIIFEEKIANFKAHLLQRGYPEDLINTTLSEVNFKDRKRAFQQKPKTNQRISPFVTQYQPSVPNLKQILMKNWHLIEQQPLLSPSYLIKEGGRSKTRHTRESQTIKRLF